jgi:hypothetical protein
MEEEKNKRGAKRKEIRDILKGWNDWEEDLMNKTKVKVCLNTFKLRLSEAEEMKEDSLEYQFLTTISFCRLIRLAKLEEINDKMATGDKPSFGFQSLQLALKQFKEYRNSDKTIEVKTEDTEVTINIDGEEKW